jgi:hypothetical protein
LLAGVNLSRDPDDLLRCLVGAENDLREPFAQRPVGIDLRESQVGHRRRLECLQHFLQAHVSGPEPLQELNRFYRCHAGMMSGTAAEVTQKRPLEDCSVSNAT